MLQQNKGWGKNVMYICKNNLTPLLYSGKIKKKENILKTMLVDFSYNYMQIF